MYRLLVIVPAYNEEDNIVATVRGIQEAKVDNCDVDILVVNDCSKDNTLGVLKTLSVNYLNLPNNLGIGGAMQSGYKYAFRNGYDFAVQMDGDGQHDPDYLKSIVSPLMEGSADLVVGSRFIDKEGFQSSWQRRMGIRILSMLIYICTGTKISDVTSGFRAANRKTIELFVNEYAVDYPEPESLVCTLLQGIRVQEIPVLMRERVNGVSSISATKSIYYMFKVSMAIVLKKIAGKKI